MSAPRRVAVIGLGMIGGSVARGLAARGVEILGYDTNNGYVDAAVAEGVVGQRVSESFDELATVDAVVLAVYGDSRAARAACGQYHSRDGCRQHEAGNCERGGKIPAWKKFYWLASVCGGSQVRVVRVAIRSFRERDCLSLSDDSVGSGKLCSGAVAMDNAWREADEDGCRGT